MQTRTLAPRAAVALTVLCAAALQTARAQDYMSQAFIPPGEETLTLQLGGIVNRFDSTLRFDGNSRRGTDFKLENNNLEHNLSTFEGGLSWRFAPRHRLDMVYFSGERSGSKRYDKLVEIGDSSFPLGADVSIQAETRLFNVDYRYSLFKEKGYEFALLLGLYGGNFKYDVTAVGTGSAAAAYHKSVSTTVPLPLLGATMDWYPNPQWKFNVGFSGMKAKVGDVDGHAYLGQASAEWMAARNWGFGARYEYLDVSATVDKSDFNGNLGVKTNGVSLYAKFMF